MRMVSLFLSAVSIACLTACTLMPASLHAQFSNPAPPPTTQVHDASVLRPPAGAKVAIIEFEDLECPDCARANPLLRDATTQHHIPWIRHDYPLPFHGWSFQAAVNARWFDLKSKKIGDDYRDQIFAHQGEITTLDSSGAAEDGGIGLQKLRGFTDKFASSQRLSLPFIVDPQGKLAAAVKADYAVGQRVGIEHTPTIWVVTNRTKGLPFVEVVDRNKLYSMIEEAQTETGK
jgi:protein-disulfide isomerase